VAELDAEVDAARRLPALRDRPQGEPQGARRRPVDGSSILRNPHTAVKPVAIMEWLVGLLCPAGGTVLDPWIGSGTTGVAAAHRGRDIVGIEREDIYHEVARLRVDHAEREAVSA
jgi:DNA modification methylase